MALDLSLLYVQPNRIDDARTTRGKPRRGFAKVKFHVNGDERFYDLRGGVATHRQFTNWAAKHFPDADGDFDVEFG